MLSYDRKASNNAQLSFNLHRIGLLTSDTSSGIYRRLLIASFDVVIPPN